MNWREVAVTVSPEGEEAVADLFYQLGCSGVNIEDARVLQSYIEAGSWDYHDFGEVGLTGTVIIKGYFAENAELQTKLASLQQKLEELSGLYPDWHLLAKGATLREEDWATAWKAYFKPQRVGRHLLIKPTWEPVAALPEDIVLEIDPGMAFGTGTHATTILCLGVLEEIVRPGMKVYDVGTGTGILAIAAAKLGAEVVAVDLDAVAVQVAAENIELNKVTDRVQVLKGDLGTVLSEQAELVVANIVADVIIDLAADLRRILHPKGEFLASGIIGSRVRDVEETLKVNGLEIVERREDSGWILVRARWSERASF
ncbi:MAG TPA: 50S ribosomal protein L11 methyltransferase [Desulfitobacteriaceae bacterium]|nr:50S ribosomal protein L11 methyltransferase [Desulfitobacteriaceae bacterium]